MEANSTEGQGSRRAVAPSDDDEASEFAGYLTTMTTDKVIQPWR